MKPYHKQPGESAKNFAAFTAWLEFGPERTFPKVSRKLSKSASLIKRWAHKFEWAERLAAWEADDAERRRLALEELAKADAVKWAERQNKVREDEYQIGQALLQRVRDLMTLPITRKVTRKKGRTTIIEPARFTTGDLARLSDVGNDLVRRASGLPTSNGKIELSNADSGGNDGPVGTGQVLVVIPDNGRDKAKP